MLAAVLDLGTNTFNLLIAELLDGKMRAIVRTREVVKLGEGGLAENRITSTAFERGIRAIANHLETIRQHDCKSIKAVATSGIRSTSNGQEFIDAVFDKFQLNIEVIDGNREAELIYKGVQLCSPISENSLIMDIGGGSTEFIVANSDGPIWKQSFKLGASRLKETFRPENPISEGTMEKIREHFKLELKDLEDALEKTPCHILLGSSGSFDTFAEMELHRTNRMELFEKAQSLPIDMNEFNNSYSFLIQSTLEERLNTPGIIPMRADMIVISGLLTQYVIEMAEIKSILLSKHALKEGLMSEMMINDLS